MQMFHWPVGLRFIAISNASDFLDYKRVLVESLKSFGYDYNLSSGLPDVIRLPDAAHSAFATQDSTSEYVWNLKFTRHPVPHVKVLLVSVTGMRTWENSLEIPWLKSAIESQLLHLAIGYASRSENRDFLTGFRAMFTGKKLLGNRSWIYAYARCVASDKISSCLQRIDPNESALWILEFQKLVAVSLNEPASEVVIVENRLNTLRSMKREIDGHIATGNYFNIIQEKLKTLSISWDDWTRK